MYLTYVYYIHMRAQLQTNTLSTDLLMKTVTVYLSQVQYQQFKMQAKKQGKKTAELIREAMDYYSETHFNQKQKMSSLSFDRGVTLASGSKDFLSDNWRDEMLDSGVHL